MLQESTRQSLRSLLPPDQVYTERTALIAYEADAGLDKGLPDGVVLPRSIADVERLVKWAAARHVSLIGRGAGTGLSGGAVADRGGVVVAFQHMDRLLELDVSGHSIVAEPALINLRLDEQVRAHGLYFPPDPSSQRASTIGGNVAENSGGPHCFKYGVTTNYINGLDLVLASGERIHVGGRAYDYPEYDLCGLLTGSEGTLGLITRIEARLVRNPPAVKTLLAVFPSIEQAGEAVSALISAGLMPATMEMMDQRIIRIIEPFAQAGLPLDAGAILIVEIDGYASSLDAQMQEIVTLLEQHGGSNMRVARDENERYKIWVARKSAAGAIARLAPAYYTIDITVPRSRLAQVLSEVERICTRYDLQSGHMFHAGDGNLHPLLLIPNPEDPELLRRIHAAGHEIVRCAVDLDGSLTGEHGVGIEKREYMGMMHNTAELMSMWEIKQTFDPQGIFNPGKIFPAANDGDAPFLGYEPGHTNVQPAETLPGEVFTPRTAEEAASGLYALSLAGRCASINKTADGTRIDTSALTGIITYAPDDLYITVGAGTPLETVQEFLDQHGQQLPLLSPWPGATVGGLVASNYNAPLRMRYGGIRDLMLCATVALPNGRLIRTGRPIVKNVAGYDLSKVFVGSQGTLGLLTDVTFKISPKPRAIQTMYWPTNDDLEIGLDLGQRLYNIALNASSVLFYRDSDLANSFVVYTAEGHPEDVKQELGEAWRTGGNWFPGDETRSGSEIWRDKLGSAFGNSLIVRVGVPPKDLVAYVKAQAKLLNAGSFMVDFASGFVYVLKESGTASEAQAWLANLRQSALALGGYAIVMEAPEEARNQLDPWGYQPEGLAQMRRLKQFWDPNNILNRGEFV